MVAPELFKSVMRRYAASVVIVTVDADTRIHGMTATSFTAVSMTPPLVLFCVHRDNTTHDLLVIDRTIGASLLAVRQERLSQRFASKGPDRYAVEDVGLERSPGGAPLIPGACAVMEAVITARHWGGDHSIFIGEMVWAEVRSESTPLLYYRGRYVRLADTAHAAAE